MRPVTVDTGGPNDAFRGACVVWLHAPRGGYGFIAPTDAKVISVSTYPRPRIRIEVTKRGGGKVVRVVKAEDLRWAK